MSKNIINVEGLKSYHQGLLKAHLEPMNERINGFESGDKFINDLNNVKSSVKNNTIGISTLNKKTNDLKIDVNDMKNTVREIDEIKENTGMNFLDSLSALFVEHSDFEFARNIKENNEGYVKLPCGLLIQWGYVPLSEQQEVIDKFWNYPTPFSDYCFSHVVSIRGENNNWDTIVSSYPMSNFHFRVVAKNKVPTIWNAVFYIAIGV